MKRGEFDLFCCCMVKCSVVIVVDEIVFVFVVGMVLRCWDWLRWDVWGVIGSVWVNKFCWWWCELSVWLVWMSYEVWWWCYVVCWVVVGFWECRWESSCVFGWVGRFVGSYYLVNVFFVVVVCFYFVVCFGIDVVKLML